MDGNDAEKKEWMKSLLNLHAGEVRETYGEWKMVPAPLPESWAWYNSQYPEIDDHLAINSFLMRCSEESKHYRRASWGFTLARLMEKFGEKYTMEAIYEFFVALPIMVTKKLRGSKRATW